MIERYLDLNGNSGVLGFVIYDTAIEVYFKNNNRSYVYSYQSAGKYHVENLKKLEIQHFIMPCYF